MAYSNNMTKLINKIERRLGTRSLNLPEHLNKESWGDIIKEESLLTFSRFYPHKIRYRLSRENTVFRDGYYIIDEDKFPGIEILGVKDMSWETYGNNINGSSNYSYGHYDVFNSGYELADIALVQAGVNLSSLVNNDIYVEFEQPNKIALKNCYNVNITQSIGEFEVDFLIKHADSLNTINPTVMETFEQLAISDVSTYLYQELKYFDGLDTIYGSIDLRLSELENNMGRREDIISTLRDSYVSFENANQPMIITV